MFEVRSVKTSGLPKFRLEEQPEVIVVMPAIDMPLAQKAAEVMSRRAHRAGLLIVAEDDLRLGFIMTANLIYAKTKSPYFGYVAQDAFPGQHWLDYGLESLKKSNSGLLSFNDGKFFGKLAVFGLALRAWVNTLYGNFIFYPEYKSHYADTELSALALKTANLVYNPECIMMEVDYEKHLRGNNPADEELYIKRAATGFDGKIEPFIPHK